MHRVRVSTVDASGLSSLVDNSVGDVEDGFVIRGVNRQDAGLPGSAREVQLRGPSFLGSPVPIYRPSARPNQLPKDSNDTQPTESHKRQHAAPRWKVTAQLARLAAHSKLTGQKGVGASVANQIVAKKWKQVGNLLKATADGVSR